MCLLGICFGETKKTVIPCLFVLPPWTLDCNVLQNTGIIASDYATFVRVSPSVFVLPIILQLYIRNFLVWSPLCVSAECI